MGVYDDCRHYLRRTTPSGEAIQKCRLGANTEDPFACPEGCLFYETRSVSDAGWTQAPTERLPNTADALAALPPEKKRRPRKRR